MQDSTPELGSITVLLVVYAHVEPSGSCSSCTVAPNHTSVLQYIKNQDKHQLDHGKSSRWYYSRGWSTVLKYTSTEVLPMHYT